MTNPTSLWLTIATRSPGPTPVRGQRRPPPGGQGLELAVGDRPRALDQGRGVGSAFGPFQQQRDQVHRRESRRRHAPGPRVHRCWWEHISRSVRFCSSIHAAQSMYHCSIRTLLGEHEGANQGKREASVRRSDRNGRAGARPVPSTPHEISKVRGSGTWAQAAWTPKGRSVPEVSMEPASQPAPSTSASAAGTPFRRGGRPIEASLPRVLRHVPCSGRVGVPVGRAGCASSLLRHPCARSSSPELTRRCDARSLRELAFGRHPARPAVGGRCRCSATPAASREGRQPTSDARRRRHASYGPTWNTNCSSAAPRIRTSRTASAIVVPGLTGHLRVRVGGRP